MSLRYAILGALAREPASGYGLVKRFDHTLNLVWWASHGAVYTQLQKLEREGLVRSDDSRSRGRILNHLTETGREAVRHWVTSDAVHRPRDELALRISSLWLAEPNEAADFLDTLAAGYRDRLQEYERRADGLGEPTTRAELFDQLALHAGIAHEHAMTSWAERSAATVRTAPPEALR